jgi:hypothetical protein
MSLAPGRNAELLRPGGRVIRGDDFVDTTGRTRGRQAMAAVLSGLPAASAPLDAVRE